MNGRRTLQSACVWAVRKYIYIRTIETNNTANVYCIANKYESYKSISRQEYSQSCEKTPPQHFHGNIRMCAHDVAVQRTKFITVHHIQFSSTFSVVLFSVFRYLSLPRCCDRLHVPCSTFRTLALAVNSRYIGKLACLLAWMLDRRCNSRTPTLRPVFRCGEVWLIHAIYFAVIIIICVYIYIIFHSRWERALECWRKRR